MNRRLTASGQSQRRQALQDEGEGQPANAYRFLGPLLLFVTTLGLYLFTLQPSLAWGDGIRLQHEAITAESFILDEMVDVQFAADPFPFARVGVAAWDHPLYVYLGHTLVRLLPGVDALWLVNVVSAVFAAGTVALLYVLCLQATASLPASLFAALALAVSHTFWWHAVTPEVYTLFTFLMLASVAFYVRYEHSGRAVHLCAALFALGLGAANHLLALLVVPGWLLYELLWPGEGGRRGLVAGFLATPVRRLLFCALAFLAGMSPYLIQFVRLLRTFPLTELLGPAAGTTFVRGSLALAPADLAASLGAYATFLFYQFSPLGVTLGLYGLWRGGDVHAPFWRKTLVLFLVYWLFGVVYKVTDQFAFFLGAHVLWAFAMGLGATLLLQRISAARRRALLVGLVGNLLLMPLVYEIAPSVLRASGVSEEGFGVPQVGSDVRDGLTYYLTPDKRGDVTAYHFGKETLATLAPDALVLTHMYSDTDEYFVFRYFTGVEGMRPDVDLVGWPTEDPFNFDATLATTLVAERLAQRPVYLASLSDDYYGASLLMERYCVVPEANLYRVYEDRGRAACLPASAAEDGTQIGAEGR